MLAKEAIELLQKYLKPDDEIVFAYWEKDAFGEDVNDELWSDVCAADHKIDWGTAHESIEYFIDYIREEDDD
jgi:hypothetical protein